MPVGWLGQKKAGLSAVLGAHGAGFQPRNVALVGQRANRLKEQLSGAARRAVWVG